MQDLSADPERGEVADPAEADGVGDVDEHQIGRLSRHVALVGILRLRDAAGEGQGEGRALQIHGRTSRPGSAPGDDCQLPQAPPSLTR